MSKLRNRLICLLLSSVLIHCTVSLASAQDLSNYQKLSALIDRIVQRAGAPEEGSVSGGDSPAYSRGAFPCWMLGADHRFAAPPPMIGLKVPGFDFGQKFVSEGLLTPEQYASGTVARIDRQNHNDAGYPKRYFFWAYDLPFDNESDDVLQQLSSDQSEAVYLNQHVLGLISFKVHLQREPYDQSKHSNYPFEVNRELRHAAHVTPYPVKYEVKKQTGYVHLGERMVPDYETVPWVAEEICYDPQPHLRTVDMSDMPWFKNALGVTNDTFTYFPGEVPTAVMHSVYANYYQEKNLQKLTLIEAKAEAALLALRIFHPVTNVFLIPRDVHICEQGGHSYCYASGIADGLAVGGALLRIAGDASKIAKFLKAANISQNRLGNSLIYLGIGSNLTLTELYRQKGEYLNAAMRLGMSGVDLSPVVFKQVKSLFTAADAPPAPSLIGVKLGTVQDDCEKVDDIIQVKNISHSPKVCASNISKVTAASDPEFVNAIQAGNWQHPGLFELIQELKVSRVDIRPPSGIVEAGGFFPNPKYRPGTAVEHVDFTHVQTGSFVSATTIQDDFSYFFRNEFFIDKSRINYLENAERDLLKRSYSAAEVSNGPPAPITHELWVYKVTGKGVPAAKVNPLETVFGGDVEIAIGEQEALTRSIPLGQGHNLEATRYQVRRPFYYVEDNANPGSYRLKLTPAKDIRDEDITKFETVLVPDEISCDVANSAQPIAAPATQHILHTYNGIKKCGSFNTATIFQGFRKVYKEPFSEWGDPVILANKYIGVSHSVGNLHNAPIKLVTFEDGGLPGVYMCDFIEGQTLYRSKIGHNLAQYTFKFSNTAAHLKARLASIYPKTNVEIGGVSQEFFDVGDGYILAVDEIFGENLIETASGDIYWIDPYFIMQREKYIEAKMSDLPDASKLEGTTEEFLHCMPDQ